MSASLKPVLGRQIRGMRQLESKISDLQTQYEFLLKERQQHITTFIATLELASLEDPLLIGGLLFIKEKVTEKDPILEAWRDAGEKFLRRSKPKSCSRPHKPKEGKHASACSRAPGKKSPLNSISTPQTTDQPSQQQPQSREA